MSREKIGRIIPSFKNLPFFCFNHRGKLIKVANKNHLFSTKRLFRFTAIKTQKFIHTIQEVSPYHRNFINNDGIHFLIDIFILIFGNLFYFILSYIRFESEKRMDGLSSNIQSSNPGRSQNHYFLFSIITKNPQKSGFTRPRFSGDKNTT